MEKASGFWDERAQECTDMLKAFAEQQAEAQKLKQDHIASANTVCAVKLQADAGNCQDLEQLTESFSKISILASPEDAQIVRNFERQCRVVEGSKSRRPR